MSRSPTQSRPGPVAGKPFDFLGGLKGLDMFFQGKDPVHRSMRRLARRLEKAGIPYAVVGGMALFAHRHRRATNDVDVLLTSEGFTAFRKLFVPKNYKAVERHSRRFVDRTSRVSVDILVTGRFPGSGKPGPIAYPDPQQVSETIRNVKVVDLRTLIQLKLAARRHQDFADVVSLMRVHHLDESFLPRLHRSLHREFIECLEERRREDEYEARENESFRETFPPDDYQAEEG
jgi:hypothetical protein